MARVLSFLIRYFSNYYTLHRSDLAARAAPLDPRLHTTTTTSRSFLRLRFWYKVFSIHNRFFFISTGIAKIATSSLIDTLQENDFFNVITVNKEANYLTKVCVSLYLYFSLKSNIISMVKIKWNDSGNWAFPERIVFPC